MRVAGISAGLLVWSTLVQMTTTMRCPDVDNDFDGLECCKKCPAGSGVSWLCSSTNDTTCEPCTLGKTFSAVESHIDVCQQCSTCPENSHVTQGCTLTEDTRCECDRNHYFDDFEGQCKLCDLCPVGHGSLKSCSHTENTRCKRCPNGTYSNRRSSHPCKVCSVCGPHQIMLSMCEYRKNTVCVDIPIPKSSTRHPLSDMSTQAQVDEKSFNIIPVYCAILGALIVGLVIYVIISQYKRHQAKKKAALAKQQGGLLPDHPQDRATSKQGSDSGVYVEHEAKLILSTKVVELGSTRWRILETMLHATNDDLGGWRHLARQCGYTPTLVHTMGLRADQNHEPAARFLLREWATNTGATVKVLVKHLQEMGRDDIAHALLTDARNSQILPRGNYHHGDAHNREPLLL